MKRMVVLTVVACSTLLAQSNSAKGPSTNNAFVLPGDTIIPRIDTGQTGTAMDGTPLGTFMTFQIMNISPGPANVQMSFVATDGSPLSLKFEICKNTLPLGGQGSCFEQLGADGLPTNPPPSRLPRSSWTRFRSAESPTRAHSSTGRGHSATPKS